MKSFIFITNEGYTYQPNSETVEPDIENCQVIGFGKGHNVKQAFNDLLKTHDYLLKSTFDEIYGIELKHVNREFFYLSNYKSKSS